MTLRADKITFAYGPTRPALRQVTIAMRPGELLGVIGPNGSGKSTLLRALAGLIACPDGCVCLDDAPLVSFGRKALARRIAFLPQNTEAAFEFTCEEIVALGRFPYLGGLGFLGGEDLAVVRRCMEQTDTLSLAGRPLGSLSGGERQRIWIASILAQSADHLLLDEPTSALDIQHQAEVFALLQTVSRQGNAVAVVAHDLNLAAQFCDRLALMSVGKIVCEGTPDEVMRLTNLAPVYGGNVAVATNPVTGGPLVVVLAAERLTTEPLP